ncbi:MAG: AgmX/PglI C-terminal domain-containing protein [Myxococcota bacterium]|nr:AgmX/PglI C-terminal domain-containing protein [Myxococcota bacterium]
MSNEQQDKEQGFSRRANDMGDGRDNAPIKMDMPDIERDAAGIPTFIFHDHLAKNDRPSAEKKTLEVVMLWREAVMTVGHYNTAKTITIGDALKNDFRVACDSIPVERFELVDFEDGNFVVHWTDQMTLEVRGEDNKVESQESLASRGKIGQKVTGAYSCSQYTIGLNDRVAIQVGELTFVLQYVSPARIVKSSLLKTIDVYFTKILSFSFLGHLFLLLALILTPLEPEGLADDLFKNPNRFAKLILKEPEKAPEPKKKFELSGSKGGGRHKDKEGKFGKTDKPKKDALASTKGAPKVDPNKREKDRKIAMESGIFKSLQGGKGGAVSNVFGPGGLGTGINNALGGLRGTAMGDAGGAGGLGTRGTGPGGGGNSLGIGGLGNGTGRGTGGLGDVDLGGRGKGKYKVSVGRTVTKGCLTQQVVLRVLSKANSQARYCYEKELQRNPNLSGKITTSFQIGSTGSVKTSRVARSTMGNGNVEKCLLRVISRLRFPPCRGGGVADVTYPWIFKSGGN